MKTDLQKQQLLQEASSLPFWSMTERQLCDVELLTDGAFAPLNQFMSQQDYRAVLSNMHLKNGNLWPMPITLNVSNKFSEVLSQGSRITLRNAEGLPIAILTIDEIWKPDLAEEAEAVFDTRDEAHPGVFYLLHEEHPVCLGGKMKRLSIPHHANYVDYRHSPAQLKQLIKKHKWQRTVAFQTRNPMHHAHIEIAKRAADTLGAGLLIHPVCGVTQPGDIDYHTRMHCYMSIMKYFDAQRTILSLLPLAMRMAGPREALWHALIRKNYGCTHIIIGRDHAAPGKDSNGKPFYKPYAAQDLLRKYQDEIGIEPVMFDELVYEKSKKRYVPIGKVKDKTDIATVSGTKMRDMLLKGETLPEWFTPPEVMRELRATYPPLKERGLTIFFTGLSGSGKSTLAKLLMSKLLEHSKRRVTLLDGDIVRAQLSSELGFSKEHRSINVRRIGFVAKEITKNGGIAICAPIAPYAADRRANRDLISQVGTFIEIYVSTPIDVCEKRDIKGFYLRAREGLTEHFTGIDDPYEVPTAPDITINTTDTLPGETADYIYRSIEKAGYL